MLKIQIAWKLSAAACLLLGCLILLTGRTAALYTDAEVLTGTIQTGFWETEKECEQEEVCGAPFFSSIISKGGVIQAVLENAGPKLKNPGKYRVYAGGPDKKGRKTDLAVTVIAEGKGTYILRFAPESSGFYTLEAMLEEGESIWSGQAEAVIADPPPKEESDSGGKEETAEPKKEENPVPQEAEEPDSADQEEETAPEPDGINAGNEAESQQDQQSDEQEE